jgi:hypothetical protein
MEVLLRDPCCLAGMVVVGLGVVVWASVSAVHLISNWNRRRREVSAVDQQTRFGSLRTESEPKATGLKPGPASLARIDLEITTTCSGDPGPAGWHGS